MTVVAACQVELDVTDVRGNVDRLHAAVVEAATAGARLVVLPELGNTGYVFESPDEARARAESPSGPYLSAVQQWSERYGAVIVSGFCEAGGDGAVYNSAALVSQGELRAVYRKVHLWDREKLVFTPGAARAPVVQTPVGRVGVMVCYDLEFPEWLRAMALAGAQIVAAPTNWPASPRPDGERPMEIVRVQASACVNRVFVVAADRCGRERGVDWVGGSVIVSPDGWPLAGPAHSGKSGVLIADLDPADADDKAISERNDVFADRRLDLYAE